MDNIFFDEISFYVADEVGRQLRKWEHISWRTLPAMRPVPSRYYAFPLDLAPHQVVRVYVKLQYSGGIFVCPITLWERAHYLREDQFYTHVYLFPISVLATLTLVSLLFWMAYRRRILLYYFLYTAGLLGFSLNIEGFLVELVGWPIAGPKGWIVCSTVSWLGSLLFTERFVFYGQNVPFDTGRRVCFGVLQVLLLLFLLVTLSSPPNGSLAFICVSINVLGPLFLFGWLLVGMYFRLPEARIYALAVSPVMASVLLIAAGGEGALPFGDKLYLLLYYAPPIEIIILGFGVVRQFFRERENLLLTVQSVQEEIIHTQEVERQRIAADLHDDLGGTLAAARFRLSNLRREHPEAEPAFDGLEKLLLKSIQDLRRISHNLMPPEFARMGLASALQHLVGAIPPEPTRFTFVTSGTPRALPLETELNVYRVGVELIQNVLKHAQARRAAVQLLYHPDELLLLVEDDGLGSQVKKSDGQRAGIGLKTGSLRAEYIGATLRREASPSGTVAVLHLPYGPAPNAPPAPA